MPILRKSKNVREQREKVFGKWKTAPDSPERKKQMSKLSQYARKRYNAPVRQAAGKVSATGKVINKPDLTTGRIEHIGNPDSLVHELAHIDLAPEGMSMADYQRHMDELWGRQNVDHGFKQQARLAPEYESTAVENRIRRRLGMPAHQKYREVTRPEQMFAADDPSKKILRDYPNKKIKTYDKKGKDVIGSRHLSAGQEVLSEEAKKTLILRDSGAAKYTPGKGWESTPTPDTLVRLRQEGYPELARDLARKYFRGILSSKQKVTKGEFKEHIPGGLSAGKKPEEFDPAALERGKQVELEHTTDATIAEEIAMDHLTEDPKYYEKLAVAEGNAPMKKTEVYFTNLLAKSKEDYLEQQKTIVPGVSSAGIEVRRGDRRVEGAHAHGYQRVTDPHFHRAWAKEYFRDRIRKLKKQPQPKLP